MATILDLNDEDLYERWFFELTQDERPVNEILVAGLEREARTRGFEMRTVLQATGLTAAKVWDPDLHPRGFDGRFIELLGFIDLVNLKTLDKKSGKAYDFSGQRGQVVGITPDPKNPGNPTIRVRIDDPKTGKQRMMLNVKPENIKQAPEAKGHLEAETPGGDTRTPDEIAADKLIADDLRSREDPASTTAADNLEAGNPTPDDIELILEQVSSVRGGSGGQSGMRSPSELGPEEDPADAELTDEQAQQYDSVAARYGDGGVPIEDLGAETPKAGDVSEIDLADSENPDGDAQKIADAFGLDHESQGIGPGGWPTYTYTGDPDSIKALDAWYEDGGDVDALPTAGDQETAPPVELADIVPATDRLDMQAELVDIEKQLNDHADFDGATGLDELTNALTEVDTALVGGRRDEMSAAYENAASTFDKFSEEAADDKEFGLYADIGAKLAETFNGLQTPGPDSTAVTPTPPLDTGGSSLSAERRAELADIYGVEDVDGLASITDLDWFAETDSGEPMTPEEAKADAQKAAASFGLAVDDWVDGGDETTPRASFGGPTDAMYDFLDLYDRGESFPDTSETVSAEPVAPEAPLAQPPVENLGGPAAEWLSTGMSMSALDEYLASQDGPSLSAEFLSQPREGKRVVSIPSRLKKLPDEDLIAMAQDINDNAADYGSSYDTFDDMVRDLKIEASRRKIIEGFPLAAGKDAGEVPSAAPASKAKAKAKAKASPDLVPEGPLEKVKSVPTDFDKTDDHRWLLPDGSWVDYDMTDSSMTHSFPDGTSEPFDAKAKAPAAPKAAPAAPTKGGPKAGTIKLPGTDVWRLAPDKIKKLSDEDLVTAFQAFNNKNHSNTWGTSFKQGLANQMLKKMDAVNTELDKRGYEKLPSQNPGPGGKWEKQSLTPKGAATPEPSGPYVPKGRTDESSFDYTDVPADLAMKFDKEQLQQAVDEAEADGSDYGTLKFDYEEQVPLQAIKEALKKPAGSPFQ